MVPQVRDVAQVELEILRGVQDLVALGVGLKHPVFDPVVHHLHVVTRARRTDVRIAVWRSQRLENGFAVAERRGRRTDHETVADRQAPDAAARAGVHELETLCLERLRPAHRVAEIRVATVDDDVSAGEMGHELLDRALHGWTGRHHHPGHTPTGELPAGIGEVARALGPQLHVRLDGLGAAVVHDDFVPALEQPPHHVAAHAAQSDHRQLHCRSSFKWPPSRPRDRGGVVGRLRREWCACRVAAPSRGWARGRR